MGKFRLFWPQRFAAGLFQGNIQVGMSLRPQAMAQSCRGLAPWEGPKRRLRPWGAWRLCFIFESKSGGPDILGHAADGPGRAERSHRDNVWAWGLGAPQGPSGCVQEHIAGFPSAPGFAGVRPMALSASRAAVAGMLGHPWLPQGSSLPWGGPFDLGLGKGRRNWLGLLGWPKGIKMAFPGIPPGSWMFGGHRVRAALGNFISE